MNAAVGATYSRYPLPHTQEPDYVAILRTLGYQTRGIFERLRDLFNGRAYIQLSLDLIAGRIGCSRGLLVSVLQELETLGLLKVYRQRIGPRRNDINRYVVPEALIHTSFAVYEMNPAPRLAVHQEGCQAAAEVHVMNFPRTRESVQQEDGFLPSVASTESESERRRKEEVEDIPSSATALQDSFSESEKARKTKVLTEAGIHPRNHKKLLAYPLADLQRAIELAREHADESFDGYVVTVLRQGFFEDETRVPLPQVEKTLPVAPYVEPAEAVKPFQEVETATPEPTQLPVPHHPQPQTQPVSEAPPLRVIERDEIQQVESDLQPAKNLDDPRGEKAALFQSVGLKPQHYTPFITYKLSDIQAAIQSARERKAQHLGHYALAILKKQPAPPHETIDYELLMNRWQEYETPPVDDQLVQRPSDDVGSGTLARQTWEALIQALLHKFQAQGMTPDIISRIRDSFIRFDFSPDDGWMRIVTTREAFEHLEGDLKRAWSFWLSKQDHLYQSMVPVCSIGDVWRLTPQLNEADKEAFTARLEALCDVLAAQD